MASSRKVKINAVHTTLFANLRLLMAQYHHSDTFADLLTEDVFALPNSNKKASNEMIFFILRVWDKTKCAEKFKFCWPVLDRKQESQFQRAACGLMQEIKAAHPEARLPTVSLALLLQPGGDKYCNFMLRLTTFLLSKSLKGVELLNRPLVKKGQNWDPVKFELKSLATDSFSAAVGACSGAEATVNGAEDFCRKLNDWWQSWEESEETALQYFKNKAERLDLPEDLKQRLLEHPDKVKDFHGHVVNLKNEIDAALCRLEGVENGQLRTKESSPCEDGVSSKEEVDLKGLVTLKQRLFKSSKELNMLLDLAERQEAWPLHSESGRMKEKMLNGKPFDVIGKLETRLASAQRGGVKESRRKSMAPSPAVTMHPSKLRQVPFTPFTTMNGISPHPYVPQCRSIAERAETVESILLRWNCPKKSQPLSNPSPPPIPSSNPSLLAHKSPSFPSTTLPLPSIKESPTSPMERYLPHQKDIPIPKLALTPPNGSESVMRRKGRRSFFDLSGEEIPLGDVSLLELAELHLSLSSGSSTPEVPSPIVFHKLPSPIKAPVEPIEEPMDVKPDIRSLMQRLQAVKDRSRKLPSVLIKSELVSP